MLSSAKVKEIYRINKRHLYTMCVEVAELRGTFHSCTINHTWKGKGLQ